MVVFVVAASSVAADVVIGDEKVVVRGVGGGVKVHEALSVEVACLADLGEVEESSLCVWVDGEGDVDGGGFADGECGYWSVERSGSVRVGGPAGVVEGEPVGDVVGERDIGGIEGALVLDCEGEGRYVAGCNGSDVGAIIKLLNQCQIEHIAVSLTIGPKESVCGSERSELITDLKAPLVGEPVPGRIGNRELSLISNLTVDHLRADHEHDLRCRRCAGFSKITGGRSEHDACRRRVSD